MCVQTREDNGLTGPCISRREFGVLCLVCGIILNVTRIYEHSFSGGALGHVHQGRET